MAKSRSQKLRKIQKRIIKKHKRIKRLESFYNEVDPLTATEQWVNANEAFINEKFFGEENKNAYYTAYRSFIMKDENDVNLPEGMFNRQRLIANIYGSWKDNIETTKNRLKRDGYSDSYIKEHVNESYGKFLSHSVKMLSVFITKDERYRLVSLEALMKHQMAVRDIMAITGLNPRDCTTVTDLNSPDDDIIYTGPLGRARVHIVLDKMGDYQVAGIPVVTAETGDVNG